MKRIFCDCCGEEIKDGEGAGSLRAALKPAQAYVNHLRIGFSGLEDEDVCKYCAIDAVSRLDDRPKPAEQVQLRWPGLGQVDVTLWSKIDAQPSTPLQVHSIEVIEDKKIGIVVAHKYDL